MGTIIGGRWLFGSRRSGFQESILKTSCGIIMGGAKEKMIFLKNCHYDPSNALFCYYEKPLNVHLPLMSIIGALFD